MTEIDIATSPSRVWQVLTDFEKYSAWNPFMTKVSGKALKDERLEITMPNPQGGTMVIAPTILAAEAEFVKPVDFDLVQWPTYFKELVRSYLPQEK